MGIGPKRLFGAEPLTAALDALRTDRGSAPNSLLGPIPYGYPVSLGFGVIAMTRNTPSYADFSENSMRPTPL